MTIAPPVTQTLINSANWGIPITDEVNSLRAAVTALQSLTTPTPWTNVTLLNGWIIPDPNLPVQYRKFLDNVQVRGTVRHADGRSTTIFNFPVGFRPAHNLQHSANAYITSWTNPVNIDLNPNGDVQYGGANVVGPQYMPLEMIFSITA